jgi:hypothetical protein
MEYIRLLLIFGGLFFWGALIFGFFYLVVKSIVAVEVEKLKEKK